MSTNEWQECSMKGVFSNSPELVSAVDILIRGLCGTPGVAFKYRDQVFSSTALLSHASANEIRAREALLPADQSWSLRYMGKIINDKKFPVSVQKIIEIPCAQDSTKMLHAMGFRKDFEYIREGKRFTSPHHFTVTVSQIYKLGEPNNIKSAQPIDPSLWFVELTAVCTDEALEETSKELAKFSEFFHPLVELSRIDAV
eukprot:GILJ01008185.1.p1 GENE.GILJ01008185.1~~GILJ01008185.1.p1  ORF type:complete len:199 (-),score=24.78 GILJ01008185.1:336-932(-)